MGISVTLFNRVSSVLKFLRLGNFRTSEPRNHVSGCLLDTTDANRGKINFRHPLFIPPPQRGGGRGGGS